MTCGCSRGVCVSSHKYYATGRAALWSSCNKVLNAITRIGSPCAWDPYESYYFKKMCSLFVFVLLLLRRQNAYNRAESRVDRRDDFCSGGWFLVNVREFCQAADADLSIFLNGLCDRSAPEWRFVFVVVNNIARIFGIIWWTHVKTICLLTRLNYVAWHTQHNNSFPHHK